MFDLVYAKLTDPQFLLSVLVAIATMATIVTVAMPLIETDTLAQRMKAVATERERIRARAVQPVEMARHRTGKGTDGDGRLSWPPGGSGVSLFPSGYAGP
jgi:hypothetical protein